MSADIVAAARGWVGTPYRHRAALRGVGCDCLGLLVGVWREVTGIEPPGLPNYRADWRDVSYAAEMQALAERWLVPAQEIAAGRVLLFRMGAAALPRHCGIMVTDGRFVHAQERLGVVEGALSDGWRKRVAAVLTFPSATAVIPAKAGTQGDAPNTGGAEGSALGPRFRRDDTGGEAPSGSNATSSPGEDPGTDGVWPSSHGSADQVRG